MGSPSLATARSYSIRELTRLTGLTADVLRVWERRYGFPKPTRDDSGARQYSEGDVQRLSLLCRAMQRGHRIGSLVELDDDELTQLAEPAELPRTSAEGEGMLQRIMTALCADDDSRLVDELRYAALNLGARAFVREVAAPVVQQIGAAWQQGRIKIRHEHLLSDLLTTQLRVLWAAPLNNSNIRVLLATLPGEQHALGLEMVGAYLAALGITPRSLGPNLPPHELADAADALNVAGIAISVSSGADLITTQLNVNLLSERLAGSYPLIVGGARAHELDLPEFATLATDWSVFEAWVQTL